MFVIYHKETTRILDKRNAYDYGFETEAAAKAGLTRAVKKGKAKAEDYAIAEATHFFANIEKKEVRHGIVGSDGAKFEVGVNTPWTSGPWSETYWSS